jgi:hypothetical protein
MNKKEEKNNNGPTKSDKKAGDKLSEVGVIAEIPQNSVKLKRSTKGQYSWEVKVYAHNEMDCITRCKLVDKHLRDLYVNDDEQISNVKEED